MKQANQIRYHGLRACQALAAHRPESVHRAFFDESLAKSFGGLCRRLAEQRRLYRTVERDELERVSGSRHHEGICLVADAPEPPHPTALLKWLEQSGEPARWLYLDGVGNPHNIGAMMRTAAHFGGSVMAGAAEELPQLNGSIARVAEGGAEHVPMLHFQEPTTALGRLRDAGFASVATVAGGGVSLHDAELPERAIFLMGAEQSGLSRDLLEAADLTLRIPGTDAVQSLNVSVATAILLAEHARQHPA